MKNLLRSRKGQGTTEYIVILAIAIGLVVTIFWPAISKALGDKSKDIATKIQEAGK